MIGCSFPETCCWKNVKIEGKKGEERNLYILNDTLKLWRSLRPGVDQVHGPVKVLHILSIHLHEWSQFLEDVSDAWFVFPKARTSKQTDDSKTNFHAKVSSISYALVSISKDCWSVLMKCTLATRSCKYIDSSTRVNTSSCSFEGKFPKSIGKKITQFPTKAGRR